MVMAASADMMVLDSGDPVAVAAVAAIHAGEVARLTRLLAENPGLATARLGDYDGRPDGGVSRTLLHVVADWPGHYPHGAQSVAALVAAGADVNARFTGPHQETPLHWAASNDDVDLLDALLDAGADIDAPGAVIGGGTPLADARGFGQWRAAERLVARGAHVTCNDAATLGMMDRLETFFGGPKPPPPAEVNLSFWGACHGGRLEAAGFLLARGADVNWVPSWEERTPLDAAARSGAEHMVGWLRERGGMHFTELGPA